MLKINFLVASFSGIISGILFQMIGMVSEPSEIGVSTNGMSASETHKMGSDVLDMVFEGSAVDFRKKILKLKMICYFICSATILL